jgi:hypothetical protein
VQQKNGERAGPALGYRSTKAEKDAPVLARMAALGA